MNAQLRLPDLLDRRMAAVPELTPFLKWPGGKSQELASIAAAAPALTGRYIDPFVGGGSVLLAVPDDVAAWANDAAQDLIALYRAGASQKASFRRTALGLAQAWERLSEVGTLYEALAEAFVTHPAGEGLSAVGEALPIIRGILAPGGSNLADLFAARVGKDLQAKFDRMRKVQADVGAKLSRRDLLANVEGAVRSTVYMCVRGRYNRARLADAWTDVRSADFLFLREFSYAAMFRFNGRGQFNVPYGGISYNRKPFSDKIESVFAPAMVARLATTEWRCSDFEPFLDEAAPTAEDFVFVDPPYDSDFSDYDNLTFGWREQGRLQAALERVPARVMVVIKDTPMIRELYRSDHWRMSSAAKTYMWTIKSRNDRETVHLTITNY